MHGVVYIVLIRIISINIGCLVPCLIVVCLLRLHCSQASVWHVGVISCMCVDLCIHDVCTCIFVCVCLCAVRVCARCIVCYLSVVYTTIPPVGNEPWPHRVTKGH